MAYVWTILPSAFLLTYFLGERSKPWYLIILGVAVFLMTAKVYGFMVLDSLNLIGNLVLLICLVIFSVKRDWTMENGHVQP
jgi:hypothetical protein